MRLGLIGRKLGMTRIYDENGTSIPVTAVEVGPCKVLRTFSEDKHGYTAVQLGFGSKRAKLVNKPEAGAFAKLGVEPVRVLRELRIPAKEIEGLEIGQELTCELFEAGQKVDVCATSKGKGFAGVIKRHNMAARSVAVSPPDALCLARPWLASSATFASPPRICRWSRSSRTRTSS